MATPQYKARMDEAHREGFQKFAMRNTDFALQAAEVMDPSLMTREMTSYAGDDGKVPPNDAMGLRGMLSDALDVSLVMWVDLPAVSNSIPVLRAHRWVGV